MKRYVVEFHRAEEGLPGHVFEVVGTYWAASAQEAMAQCPYRTTEEGEFLWARAAGA